MFSWFHRKPTETAKPLGQVPYTVWFRQEPLHTRIWPSKIPMRQVVRVEAVDDMDAAQKVRVAHRRPGKVLVVYTVERHGFYHRWDE